MANLVDSEKGLRSFVYNIKSFLIKICSLHDDVLYSNTMYGKF